MSLISLSIQKQKVCFIHCHTFSIHDDKSDDLFFPRSKDVYDRIILADCRFPNPENTLSLASSLYLVEKLQEAPGFNKDPPTVARTYSTYGKGLCNIIHVGLP